MEISIFLKLRQIGLFGFVRCIASKIHLYFLQKKYKFNKWHMTAPYSCRPYKQEVVNIVNSLNICASLEIGCGLGEISSRFQCDHKFACDQEESVISAATFLFGESVNFFTASMDDFLAIKDNIRDINIDILILINWTHDFSFSWLEPRILKLVKEHNIRFILIDGIKTGILGYLHTHSPELLNHFGKIILSKESIDSARTFYLIECSSI